MLKNKSGLIRIVEAFAMILIIAGVLLTVLNKGYVLKSDNSEKIYESEQAILRGIQLNDSLRDEILALENLAVEWDDFPLNVKNEITFESPVNFECQAKICNLNEICVLSQEIEKEIYAQKTIITANLAKYSPRELKVFCWEK